MRSCLDSIEFVGTLCEIFDIDKMFRDTAMEPLADSHIGYTV